MTENSEIPAPQITYFKPGQVVFHVRGHWNEWGQIGGNLVEWATNHLDKWQKSSFTGSVKGQRLARIEKGKVNLSQIGKSVSIKVNGKVSSTLALYSLDLGEQLEPLRFLKLLKFLDGARWLVNIGLFFLGVKLQAVTPNWLMSGGSQPSATGGPGNEPFPFLKDPTDPTSWEDITDPGHKHEFHLDAPSGLPADRDQWGSNVVVGIFDTVPPETVDKIYTHWVKEKKDNNLPPHPLIEALCDPNKLPLDIHSYPGLDRALPGVSTYNFLTSHYDTPPGLLQALGHDCYKMTDHGLFIAGIVRSLAPKAEIHLYQVLNCYGVGDLVSVYTGLNDFYNQFAASGKPLVVNLSLTFNMPLTDEHIAEGDNGLGKQILNYKPKGFIGKFIVWICEILRRWLGWYILWTDRQSQPLHELCDELDKLGAYVIAAAGNDHRGQNDTPQARYPAAFESVLGVGALQRFDPNSSNPARSANYSNLSDRPKSVGVTTFGGEKGENGVLGIYIGEFPGHGAAGSLASQNGWGWWSGTSFAGPAAASSITIMLTGSSPNNNTGSNRAKIIIDQLINAQTTAKGRKLVSDKGEDVLAVTQGP